MKLMPCPLNGPRNIQEFAYGGEVRPLPDTDADAATWADWTFLRSDPNGVVCEWWCHVPTTYWFIAERDTRTDTILATYAADQLTAAPSDTTA